MNVTLIRTEPVAEHIQSFYFKPERPLRYVAGQFIELTIPHANPDSRGTKHWFTLSSAPGHELVTITTKHADKPSTFKQALFALKPGDSLDMSEPMGDFVLPIDSSQPLVFIAGGIGITPFHSIVQWLLDTKQTRRIQMLYSVHSEAEIAFRETFTQDFIDLQVLIDQPGLTAEEIDHLVSGFTDKQLFISGPEPMTEALVEQFKKDYGMTQDQLITDYFPGYLSNGL